MGGKRVAPTGRYEVRDHPSLGGLVVIWWVPEDGPPQRTNMTLAQDRVPVLAEALADWELAHHAVPPPRRAGGGLRAAEARRLLGLGPAAAVTDDGTV